MNDTMELLPIDAATAEAPAAQRTDVAVAAAGGLDLAKVDLKAVALAQFKPQREALALAKKTLAGVVHDLPTQAKVDDAVSLRNRLIKQPIADARATSKAVKSKLTQTAADVTAEEESIVKEFTEAAQLITPQIDAAQKKIDDEKEAKRLAKEKRLQGLRDHVDAIMAKWLDRCKAEGITAARISAGIQSFALLQMPDDLADVKAYWATATAATLASMDALQAAAAKREEEARLEAQRLENERIAAENARIAAEAAAESARVAAAAAAAKAEAEALMEQARQMLAAAEAKRAADELAATQAIREQHEAAERREKERHAAEQAETESAHSRAEAPAAAVAVADTPDSVARMVENPGLAPEATPNKDAHEPEAAAAGAHSAGEAPRIEAVAQDADGEPAAGPGMGSGDSERGADVASAEHGSSFDPPDAAGLSGLGDEAGRSAAAAAGSEQVAAISDTIRDRVMDLKALATEARESRFPRQPKMTPEWWAAHFAAVDALVAEVAQ